MRSTRSRTAATILSCLLVAACAPVVASPAASPPSPAASLAAASAYPSLSYDIAAASASPAASPSIAPSSAFRPIRRSAREIGLSILMAPGPNGGLYVLMPGAKDSVVVTLFDSTGLNASRLAESCFPDPCSVTRS